MSSEHKRSGWRTTIWLAVVGSILLFGVKSCYGPPRFWGDFVGRTEAEAVQSLGQPFYDSGIQGDDKPGQPFNLFWYYGLNRGLVLEFDAGGTVYRQTNDSK